MLENLIDIYLSLKTRLNLKSLKARFRRFNNVYDVCFDSIDACTLCDNYNLKYVSVCIVTWLKIDLIINTWIARD